MKLNGIQGLSVSFGVFRGHTYCTASRRRAGCSSLSRALRWVTQHPWQAAASPGTPFTADLASAQKFPSLGRPTLYSLSASRGELRHAKAPIEDDCS